MKELKKADFIESEFYGPAPVLHKAKLGEGEATTTFKNKRIVMTGEVYLDFVFTKKFGPQLQVKIVSKEQPKIESRSRENIKWARTELYLSPKQVLQLTEELQKILLREEFWRTLKDHYIKTQ